ncbi:hypothetical protein [Streptomyces sp. NPDC093093]|uniref:Rv1733c family protein n=1 Tax=Streptomyces sp. NPDC093093 TaxID=3366025 RepID=UPI00382ABCB4
MVGRTAWTDADHDADETARHRHSVTAVTVGETTFRAGSGSSTRPLTVAPATWRDPLQRLHTDTVPVPAATRSGDTVQLLVDDNGKAATAPPRTAEIALTAIAFGTGASAGIVLAAGAVIHTCLRLVDTRCARAWESEWESVEPQWSGRLRPGHGTGDD